MGAKCCACAKEFAAGDSVITFFFERVLQGEKSGQPGFYPHPNSPEEEVDHVHFEHSCLEKCFSPVDNPFMYDLIADRARQEILDEERDFGYHDDFPEIMYDHDDPPYCLWCKREDTVWLQIRKSGTIFFCQVCNKIWDDEEYELVWDAAKGDYVDID